MTVDVKGQRALLQAGIVKMYRETMLSQQAIADALGCSPSQVNTAIHKLVPWNERQQLVSKRRKYAKKARDYRLDTCPHCGKALEYAHPEGVWGATILPQAGSTLPTEDAQPDTVQLTLALGDTPV